MGIKVSELAQELAQGLSEMCIRDRKKNFGRGNRSGVLEVP